MIFNLFIFFLVLALIAILIIIIIKYSKTSNTTIDTNTKLDNIIKIYNIKTVTKYRLPVISVLSNVFSNLPVIITISDIFSNFKLFCDYTFPFMDYDEVNTILKDNGISLTMFEIADKHKNDEITTPQQLIKIQKEFPGLAEGSDSGFILYIYILSIADKTDKTDETDETEKKTKLKLFFISNLMISNIFRNEVFKLANNTNANAQWVINDDYKTNETLNLYLRTDNNKNIELSDAIENNDMTCYGDKLCKRSISDISNFMDMINKLSNKNSIITIKRLFHLKFALYLSTLEDASILDKISKEMKVLSEQLASTQ